MTEKRIERAVISGPLLDLVRENNVKNFEEFIDNIYDTEEYHDAIRTALKWAFEYIKTYEE